MRDFRSPVVRERWCVFSGWFWFPAPRGPAGTHLGAGACPRPWGENSRFWNWLEAGVLRALYPEFPVQALLSTQQSCRRGNLGEGRHCRGAGWAPESPWCPLGMGRMAWLSRHTWRPPEHLRCRPRCRPGRQTLPCDANDFVFCPFPSLTRLPFLSLDFQLLLVPFPPPYAPFPPAFRARGRLTGV